MGLELKRCFKKNVQKQSLAVMLESQKEYLWGRDRACGLQKALLSLLMYLFKYKHLLVLFISHSLNKTNH